MGALGFSKPMFAINNILFLWCSSPTPVIPPDAVHNFIRHKHKISEQTPGPRPSLATRQYNRTSSETQPIQTPSSAQHAHPRSRPRHQSQPIKSLFARRCPRPTADIPLLPESFPESAGRRGTVGSTTMERAASHEGRGTWVGGLREVRWGRREGGGSVFLRVLGGGDGAGGGVGFAVLRGGVGARCCW